MFQSAVKTWDFFLFPETRISTGIMVRSIMFQSAVKTLTHNPSQKDVIWTTTRSRFC